MAKSNETALLINQMASAYLDCDMPALAAVVEVCLSKVTTPAQAKVHSNLLHAAFTYRGLAALEAGDVAQAKAQLLLSIGVPNNGVLMSFGPNMLLARDLAKLGHFEIVLQYLALAKKKWWWPLRLIFSRGWEKALRNGEIPSFHFLLIGNLVSGSQDSQLMQRFRARVGV